MYITENRENRGERFFYVAQDSNYNVLGVVYTTGVLCERYEYTPYGRRTAYSRGWLLADLNDDGAVDSADTDIYSGVSNTTNPPHRADLNGDGVINISDFSLINAETPFSAFNDSQQRTNPSRRDPRPA